MARPKTKIIKTVKAPRHFKGALLARLYESRVVEVPGIGTFQLVEIKPSKHFHNFSGKVRTFPGYTRLKFTQSPDLKAELTKRMQSV